MSWIPYLTMSLLAFVGTLLILIILLQRGRGGGLAGALGGMGGQSALGTKAGDVFTRITIGLAIFWVVLAATNVYALRLNSSMYAGGSDAVPAIESSGDGETKSGDPGIPTAPADPLNDPVKTETGSAAANPTTELSEPKESAPATTEPATGSPEAPAKPESSTPAATNSEDKPAEDKAPELKPEQESPASEAAPASEKTPAPAPASTPE